MITLKKAIIVEGKYDKIALENLIDSTIITLGGFHIFKDKEKRALISMLAKRDGIIILTDSDSAGMLIRSYIKKICPEGQITHVYIPQLKGKEKRKPTPSKEGFLGVEGLDKATLLEAFEKSGVFAESTTEKPVKITKNDLFMATLCGRENSASRRNSFAEFCSLPQNFSSSAFLDMLNAVFTKEEFEERLKLWLQETDKK